MKITFQDLEGGLSSIVDARASLKSSEKDLKEKIEQFVSETIVPIAINRGYKGPYASRLHSSSKEITYAFTFEQRGSKKGITIERWVCLNFNEESDGKLVVLLEGTRPVYTGVKTIKCGAEHRLPAHTGPEVISAMDDMFNSIECDVKKLLEIPEPTRQDFFQRNKHGALGPPA